MFSDSTPKVKQFYRELTILFCLYSSLRHKWKKWFKLYLSVRVRSLTCHLSHCNSWPPCHCHQSSSQYTNLSARRNKLMSFSGTPSSNSTGDQVRRQGSTTDRLIYSHAIGLSFFFQWRMLTSLGKCLDNIHLLISLLWHWKDCSGRMCLLKKTFTVHRLLCLGALIG